MNGSNNNETRGPFFRIEKFFWREILWAWLAPRRRGGMRITVSGVGLLVFITLAGVGAFTLGSSALYIAFAILVTVLALSVVLAWLNMRALGWQLRVEPPFRAGSESVAVIEIFNGKRLSAARALCAIVRSESRDVERLWLGNIESRGSHTTAWILHPQYRGTKQLELLAIGSVFPFGFFEKKIFATRSKGGRVLREISVWPSAIEYRRLGQWLHGRVNLGAPIIRVGQGTDLLALRDYRSGDSQRRIHWRASARLGRLMVREFAAEQREGIVLWVRTDAAMWRDEAQFEAMCSLAATLAEDLFSTRQLTALVIDNRRHNAVRSRVDVDSFLNALATITPSAENSGSALIGRQNVMSFTPEGDGIVRAYINGKAAAST